jgi:hypothetical protein
LIFGDKSTEGEEGGFMKTAPLVRKFKEAGLELKMAEAAFSSNTDVFGMDIQRKTKGNRRMEFFRIWPGHEDNQLHVVGLSKKLRQLVLVVQEPEREFEDVISRREVVAAIKRFRDNWAEAYAKETNRSTRDIIRRNKAKELLVFRRKTPEEKRHFLLGVDERQLFISQIPKGCSTVRAAHENLKPGTVQLAEGKFKTSRQGEWFFLETTDAERRFCNSMVRDGLVKKKLSLGPGGNPHTADELIIVPGKALEHGWPVRENDIYIRGAVRHVDHKTLKFRHWRRVIRNAESVQSGVRGPRGVFWVD